MKRLISISLALIFFLTTVGLNLNFHYCADFLHSINIAGTFDPDSCCGEEKEKDPECCTDVVSYLVLEQDALLFSASESWTKLKTISGRNFGTAVFEKQYTLEGQLFNADINSGSGPPLSKLRSYRNHLVNQVFLI